MNRKKEMKTESDPPRKNESTLPRMFSRIAQTGFPPRKLVTKTTSIIGVGGLGALVANMLVRLGIGHVILVDRDYVGEENLNRLGYAPDDLGKAKVEAIREQLEDFKNMRGAFPLQVDAYQVDIIAWQKLKELVAQSDLVFGCLDNLKARLEVNYQVIDLETPLVDGGTSPNGLRGRVDVVLPGKYPCLGCYYDDTTLTSFQEEARTTSCNLSLPTIMNITASLQVDQGLRVLLGKEGIYPRIFFNFENDVDLVKLEEVKKRKDCRFCGNQTEK